MVKFTVKSPSYHHNITMYVTGNCDQLGNWVPQLAKPLTRDVTCDTEDIWSTSICTASLTSIDYRFFLGCILQKPGAEPLVTVLMWESYGEPRTADLSAGDATPTLEAAFGYIKSDRAFLDHGWLTGQSEIQMRICDMMLKTKADSRISIKCTPQLIMPEDSAHQNGVIGSFCSPLFYTSFGKDGTHIQPNDGILFHGNNDFLTFKVYTCVVDALAFRFDITNANNTGSVYLKTRSTSKYERLELPIVTAKQEIVGTLSVDVLIVDSVPDIGKQQLDGVHYFIPHRWTASHHQSITIGHRGLGSSYMLGQKYARLPENTLKSMTEAGKQGANMVEFDVLLTCDGVPVIFHDFVASVSANRIDSNEPYSARVSVADLTLQELKSVKVQKCLDFPHGYPSNDDEQPFPTLRDCFEKLDPNLAFDVEIKYGMLRRETRALEDGMTWFPERNFYVDAILQVIWQYAGNRQLCLTCFDPDVCMMLRIKQARYPVLFLSQGETKKYPAFLDPRAASLELAIEFAVAESLAGVAVHTEGLLKKLDLIEHAHKKGLSVYCWGTDNNSSENRKLLLSKDIDGICYDRIDE